MLQITEESIIVEGTPLQPHVFPALVKRHPSGIDHVLALEAAGRRLVAGGFSDKQLADFIRTVCQWGGYPKTANRVLGGNDFSEIRGRFGNAIEALTFEPPHITLALREVRRIRHLGLSFASKHLRLMRPDLCPVLDSVLSEKFGYPLNLPGYKRFSDDCLRIAGMLETHGVENPLRREGGVWYPADVEMALFVYVKMAPGPRADISASSRTTP